LQGLRAGLRGKALYRHAWAALLASPAPRAEGWREFERHFTGTPSVRLAIRGALTIWREEPRAVQLELFS